MDGEPESFSYVEVTDLKVAKKLNSEDRSKFHFCNMQCDEFAKDYLEKLDNIPGTEPIEIERYSVRTWAIECNTDDKGYGSGGYDSDDYVENEKAFRPLVHDEKTVDVLGGRKALSELAIRRNLAGCGGTEATLCLEHRRVVDILFDCAACDILPSPEEVWPSMQDVVDRFRSEFCCVPFPAVSVDINWNHCRTSLSLHALRRLPALSNDKEFSIKRVNATPICMGF